MKERIIKAILIVIMLLGIAFSISNFISSELRAAAKAGSWVHENDVKECMGFGNECDPFAYLPR